MESTFSIKPSLGIAFDAIVCMKMKRHIAIFILLAALSFSVNLDAQSDFSKKLDSIKFSLDAGKQLQPLQFKLVDTLQRTSILDVKQQPYLIGFKPQASSYFDPLRKPNSVPPSFMKKETPLDDDILVKRSFMGQDTSNNITLKSDVSLGTFHTNTNKVKLEVRDFSLVDGDRIKVYVNEQVINNNIMLNATSYVIIVDLNKGYNRIDVEALNQGYSGPNTAELRVFDEHGYLLSAQEWNIATGNIATLGVIKN